MNSFIELIAPMVIDENDKRGKPLFPSVVIAQAIVETGWGKSNLMMKANAIFGIKATNTWTGKVYNTLTKECYDGVNMTNINASFRAYDRLQDSIFDYFELICKSKRYRRALTTSTPLECITEIKNGGYATDPNYIKLIMNVINDNNLTSFDKDSNVENVKNSVDCYYTVQAGDNLTKIAKEYRTTVDKIVKDNNISNKNLIYPNQKLLIRRENEIYYTVKAGDNLTKIAREFRTSVDRIVKNNNIQNPNLIFPNQKLVIK